MQEKTYHIQVTEQTGLWVIGAINQYPFEAKVYDKGSPFGIDTGRVVKLAIASNQQSREVVGYERGWETYPETRELEDMMEALLQFCEGLPLYEVRRKQPVHITSIITLNFETPEVEGVRRMKLNYKVMGEPRKDLAKALSEILGTEARYLGAPSFSYQVGNYTVDMFGSIICPDLMDQNMVDDITGQLAKRGFEVDSIDNPLTVQLPRTLYDSGAIARLEQIIHNKEPLFKRAFQTEDLTIRKDDEKLSFPWFTLTGNPHEVEAYTTFVAAIGKMAREQKRIIPQIYTGTNDKYTMRLFLVRLGLKGKEHKETRKILMQNLTGNGAWKDGVPPDDTNNNEENTE